MTPLRQRFVEYLRLRNYAERTVETYVRCVAHLARHFGRSPEVLGGDEDRSHQLHPLELFPGADPRQHLNRGHLTRPCARAIRACGITKKAGLHTLRHSYATHCLEGGCDLPTLQRLLGHNQASTTLGYVHLCQEHLQRLASPLDTLLGQEDRGQEG